jgi:hypothetical protein
MILSCGWVLSHELQASLIPLTQPGGRDIPVTSENVEEYIREILDAIIGNGAQLQAKAFRDGFSKVFPISDLQAFSADELVTLFGESEEDWSVESKDRLRSLYIFLVTPSSRSFGRSSEG